MNRQQLITMFQMRNIDNISIKLPPSMTLTPSAVLILFVERRGQIKVILTRRTKHLRHHPGQISFVGGKADADDRNLRDTALRETFEELGISAKKITIFSELPNFFTITGFDIKPYLAFIEPDAIITANKDEVADVIEIDLQEFIHHNAHFVINVPRNGIQYPIHFKPSAVWPIWGATAAMLEQIRLVIRD